MSLRSLRHAGALLALVLASPSAAAAQSPTPQPDRGLFGIAPAKVLLETEPPRDVQPLQLTNTTRLTYDVRIFAAPLRPAEDGGLTYDDSAAGRRLGRRTLRLAATRYTMSPDSRRDLGLQWLKTFPGQRVAPMGIVVEGVPRGADEGSLNSRYRLVASYLLQVPGGSRSGDFERLTAEQGPERSLLFDAVVKNTGDVYDEPRGGRVVVRDAGGRAVARGAFKGELLLPGTSRGFPVTIRKVLQKGRYTATASMRFGGRRREISSDFELVGPNELPTTKLEITDLQGVGYVGEPARVKVRVRNSGNTPAVADVGVRLNPGGGERMSPGRQLAPGKDAVVEVELGDLRERDYEVAATVSADGKTFDTASIAITPRPERTLFSRVERWIRDNPVLAVSLLALVVLAVVLASTWRYRRRLLARAAAAPQAPAAPVAAAVTGPPSAADRLAPGNAKIDLNTATVDELALVPGIGPRAAQRIVDWRDEYGRFTSPGDLLKVEGFDRDRILALGRYLTL